MEPRSRGGQRGPFFTLPLQFHFGASLSYGPPGRSIGLRRALLLPSCPPGALRTFRWLPESVFPTPPILLSARSFLCCLPSPPRVPDGNGDWPSPSPLDCEPRVDRDLVNPFLTIVSPAPSTICSAVHLTEWARGGSREAVLKGQPPGVPEPAATSQDHQVAHTTYCISPAVQGSGFGQSWKMDILRVEGTCGPLECRKKILELCFRFIFISSF